MIDTPPKIEAEQKCRLDCLCSPISLRAKERTDGTFGRCTFRGSKRPGEQPYLAHRSTTTFRFPGASAIIVGLREDEKQGHDLLVPPGYVRALAELQGIFDSNKER
jgi:hypothetical protein